MLLEQTAKQADSPKDRAFERLRSILAGEASILPYACFLERSNHADQLSLRFLRNNLDRLGKAFNGSKFTTTNDPQRQYIPNGVAMLQPYLPPARQHGAAPTRKAAPSYSLGLIYAARGREVIGMLLPALCDSPGEGCATWGRVGVDLMLITCPPIWWCLLAASYARRYGEQCHWKADATDGVTRVLEYVAALIFSLLVPLVA